MMKAALTACAAQAKARMDMLPEGWKRIQIKDCGTIVTGSTPDTRELKYYGDEFLFVSPKDMDVNKEIFTSEKKLSLYGYSQCRKVRKGATLCTCIGSTIGKIAFAGVDLVTNQQINSVIPNNYFDDNYIYYALSNISNNIKNRAGTQAIPIINKSEFSRLYIIAPKLEEQNKIGSIISTWDKAISTTDALLANSRQQKKALMQQLLTGKRRLPGFTGEWKKCLLGNLLREIKRQISWDDNAFYKLLSVKRRSEGVVLREIMQGKNILTKKMNEVYAGDFLISKMQVVHGAMAMVPENFDKFHVSDSYITLIPRRSNILYMPFFDHFSRQLKMYHMALISSYGVHIEKMTFNIASFLKKSIFIPVDISEQRAIAAVLDAADREIVLLEQKAARLREEKKALMQQLLTGKRRVRL